MIKQTNKSGINWKGTLRFDDLFFLCIIEMVFTVEKFCDKLVLKKCTFFWNETFVKNLNFAEKVF